MSYFRVVPAPLACLALAAFLAGCAGKSGAPKAETGKGEERPEGRSSDAPAPPAPKRPLKAAKDLKVPDGLDSPVNEIKMRRSWWFSYEDARVGDLAEYEFPGSSTRSRIEVFDLGDHAVM